MEKQHIYVVEDDESIRAMVVYALTGSSYQVTGCASGEDFFAALDETDLPDLVLLDIMLPGEDGLTILKRLRANAATANISVIMLTAKSTEMDKVRGLDSGADDYVAKPFGILELLSRVRAVIRRSGRASVSEQDESEHLYRYGNLMVDPESHVACVDGDEVHLTRKEFRLLCELLKHQGRVLSRDQLIEQVWEFDYGGETRTVDIHVNTLRKKIGDDGSVIQTVRGVGYKIG